MTLRALMHRIVVPAIFSLLLSGCGKGDPLAAVKAVAVGVPSLAPFFEENSGLGRDAVTVRSQPVRGSLQQGDTPGLYGGSKQPTICDVAALERFLTDPGNHRKAQAWANVLNIGTDAIPEYLDRLTPVLLRHDTLVENHDYKKEKAVPYNSLLQAGIAILIDEQGLPAVKCSCGNPLRPFKGDTGRISVRFEDGNKKWAGYARGSVVAVKPAPRKLARVALVDVREPARGISRPVGSTGEKDTAFDARKRRTVPDLVGRTFARAGRELVDAGLAAGYAGQRAPSGDARVTATDPPAGTELPFGRYVTLTVAGGDTGASGGTGGGTNGGTSGPTTTPPPPSSGSGTPPTSTPASSGPPTSPGGRTGPSSPTKPPSPSKPPPSTKPPSPSKPPPSTKPPSPSSSPSGRHGGSSSPPPSTPPPTASAPTTAPVSSSAPPSPPPPSAGTAPPATSQAATDAPSTAVAT